MSKQFKKWWGDNAAEHAPILDAQTLDFHIDDLTNRLFSSRTYPEWVDLYQQRERANMARNTIASRVDIY